MCLVHRKGATICGERSAIGTVTDHGAAQPSAEKAIQVGKEAT